MQENLKIVHPARRRARANLPGKGGDHPGKRGRRISDTHETETEREEEEEEEDAIQTEESYTLQVKSCFSSKVEVCVLSGGVWGRGGKGGQDELWREA